MPYFTQELTISSTSNWKQPISTDSRKYHTKNDFMRHLSWLSREYGNENVVHMPKKGDLNTGVVYIRLS